MFVCHDGFALLAILVEVVALSVLEKGVVRLGVLGAQGAADPREAGQVVGLHMALHSPAVAVFVWTHAAVEETP